MKSLVVYYWCVKITQCGYMKHGLEHITFYVQKHITPLLICSNPPLFATSRQERSYLWDLSIAELEGESKQRLREQTTGTPHSGWSKLYIYLLLSICLAHFMQGRFISHGIAPYYKATRQ